MAKRGNPNWGKEQQYPSACPTEFDVQVAHLRLTQDQYVASVDLRRRCHHNRNRFYVPEWLLKEWGMDVEDMFSGTADGGRNRGRHGPLPMSP
jgi:hypothetical protein